MPGIDGLAAARAAAARRADRLPKTLDEHLSQFHGAAPAQRAGDNSPSYLMSHDAAARVAELQPEARIIAILRESASFCARSIFGAATRAGAALSVRHALLSGEPDRPDEELTLELRRRFKDEVVAASAYLGRDLITLWGYDSAR
jgi:hypothetical protein